MNEKLELQQKIQVLEDKLERQKFFEDSQKEAQNKIFFSEEVLMDKKREISRLEGIIKEKVLELETFSDNWTGIVNKNDIKDKFSSKSQKDFDETLACLEKLSEVLKVPCDIKIICNQIEKVSKQFEETKEKCTRFKIKKKELLDSFSQKNLEIQQKIKNINKEKIEIEREKAELEKEKIKQKSVREKIKNLKNERKTEKEKLNDLKIENNRLENEKIKIQCQINTLEEECQLFLDKKIRIFNEAQKMQDLYDLKISKPKDSEIQKLNDLEIRKVKDFEKNIFSDSKHGTEKSKELENIKNLIVNQHQEILDEIKNIEKNKADQQKFKNSIQEVLKKSEGKPMKNCEIEGGKKQKFVKKTEKKVDLKSSD